MDTSLNRHSIQPLNLNRCKEATYFVCSEFVSSSVLHTVLNISLDDYIDHMSSPILSLICEGMSFIAVDEATDEIIGCILAGEFNAVSSSDSNTTAPKRVPEFAKIIDSLLSSLTSCYQEKREVTSGSTVFVDIAVVSSAVRGQGIYTALRERVHGWARAHHYTHIIGELSSATTQYVCTEKLGHKVICEIPYKSFEYNGKYPFASIEEPKSIQLVEGIL